MIQPEILSILRERVLWLQGKCTIETFNEGLQPPKEPIYIIKNNGDSTWDIFKMEDE